jgi:glyoxylase-like metal-dependent hydrolase (beta-lactamase superfamily II)
MAPSRRQFLQLMLSGAAAASWSPLASAQTSHAPLTSTPLGDHLHLFSGGGGNVLLVTSGDGLVLVNGGAAERSNELLKLVAAQSKGKRLAALFNTDWCADHTGSNEALGAIGVPIIAHENTRQYLANDQFVEWQKRTYKAKPKSALPTKTIYTKDSMAAGSERIEYGHLGQAHTDGDIYVHLPVSNVLVAGDVLAVGKYPMADYTTGGWLGGLLTATKTLLDLSNDQTRIVPGSGPLQTRADLQAQHDMLSTLRDRVAKMMRQGMSAADMLAAGATKEYDARWGDPKQFLTVTYRGMWLHVRELGGIV